MKLDKKDKQLLTQLYLNSRQSFTTLGKKLRLSSSSIERRLRKLQEAGIVSLMFADVNLAKLGFKGYRLYFKFDVMDAKTEKELLKLFENYKRTLWGVICQGEYDVLWRIIAKDEIEVEHAMSIMLEKFGKKIVEKTVITTTYQTYLSAVIEPIAFILILIAIFALIIVFSIIEWHSFIIELILIPIFVIFVLDLQSNLFNIMGVISSGEIYFTVQGFTLVLLFFVCFALTYKEDIPQYGIKASLWMVPLIVVLGFVEGVMIWLAVSIHRTTYILTDNELILKAPRLIGGSKRIPLETIESIQRTLIPFGFRLFAGFRFVRQLIFAGLIFVDGFFVSVICAAFVFSIVLLIGIA